MKQHIIFKMHYWQSLKLRLRHPRDRLQSTSQTLDELQRRLLHAFQRQHAHHTHKIHLLTQTLQTLSPLATMHRGYAIVKNAKGEIIRTSAAVKAGDQLITQVYEGEIVSRVE
jgi:exodeoxyribonuclease VII large subunit